MHIANEEDAAWPRCGSWVFVRTPTLTGSRAAARLREVLPKRCQPPGTSCGDQHALYAADAGIGLAANGHNMCMSGYVLVGGWPGSGKTTLARALASELHVSYLSKDEVKEALMDSLGTPTTVEQSRQMGVAAVHAVLRAARGCPAAVIDSTWFPYSLPLVRALAGPFVEVRCRVDVTVARERYRRRVRDERHLDSLRPEEELWGKDVPPLGVGPLMEVETTRAVDAAALAQAIRIALSRPAFGQ